MQKKVLNVRPNYFSLVMDNIVILCVIKKYLNNVVAGSKNVEITPSIHPLFIFSFASWSKVLLTKFCDGLFFFFRGSKLYNSEALPFTYDSVCFILKFIYSEKVTKFCEIFT